MYQRNLMICLLGTLFWLMVTTEPKNASAQTPGTPSGQTPGPPSKTETKATMDDAKGLLWAANVTAFVVAVNLVLLLILLIAKSRALADRPTRQQLQADLNQALADRPTRQQLQADLNTALADRPTRQQLQADLDTALKRLKRSDA